MKKILSYAAVALSVMIAVLTIGAFKAEAAPLSMPDGTVFDPVYYADSYADLKAAFGYNGGLLWNHYQIFGRNEGRIAAASNQPCGSVKVMPGNVLFDSKFYSDTYPDLKAAFGENESLLWKHYQNCGRREGRQAYYGEMIVAPSAPISGTQAAENLAKVNRSTGRPFLIKVNRAACTVTVYGMDDAGNYSLPCCAFVCSPGVSTPVGTFRSGQNARWLAFDGGQYGQYAKRISGHYWFHSVMYNGRNEGNLDWPAFNNLGTVCSHGCVRLQAGDAKWIYDNCPVGTTVEIYDDAANPGPLGKPEAPKIAANDPRRGWDPTDPNPANPWWK